jgi:hypothetical protein
MGRPLLPVITLVSSLVAISPCAAQTLSSRPAVFADPLLSIDPPYGDLVLGRTTLTAALRMFAVELEDSVLVPRGHPSNPDTVWTGTGFGGPSKMPQPYHRLNLGSARYTLYFDRHERLVAAKADRSQLSRALRREDLVARYPTLRAEYSGRSAEGRRARDSVVAPLSPCVSLIATIFEGDDGLRDGRHLMPGTVLELGYTFTCATIPAPQKAVLNKEP